MAQWMTTGQCWTMFGTGIGDHPVVPLHIYFTAVCDGLPGHYINVCGVVFAVLACNRPIARDYLVLEKSRRMSLVSGFCLSTI